MDIEARAALEHQLGQILKMQRRYKEALAHMEVAERLTPKAYRDRALDRAIVQQHLCRFEEAAATYRALLDVEPMDLEAHLLLNESLHRLGRDDELLASYDQALARLPGKALLAAAKGRFLLKLGRPDQARKTFQVAIAMAPGDAGIVAGLAGSLEALCDPNARATFESALNLSPDSGEILESFSSFLLRQGDAKRATQLAEKACALRPASQGAWALLGLCWRANSDARESWLNAYEQHVQIYDLVPPQGAIPMAQFNAKLASYLQDLHGGAQQYLTQTLRGGTQIHDEMFYNGHGLIDRLLPSITAAIQDYVARAANDADHPFGMRRKNGFRYAGSWSSCLGDGGYHVNHIHQQGWISSVYYIAVPVSAGEDMAGWLKFGEPSGDFGKTFPPRRMIQPLPGRLILFPSYFWHGTVPFQSPHSRITIAFDALPA